MAKNGRPGLPREVRVRFWDGVRAGLGTREAAAAAGAGKSVASLWFAAAGGVKGNGPRAGSGAHPPQRILGNGGEPGAAARQCGRDGAGSAGATAPVCPLGVPGDGPSGRVQALAVVRHGPAVRAEDHLASAA